MADENEVVSQRRRSMLKVSSRLVVGIQKPEIWRNATWPTSGSFINPCVVLNLLRRCNAGC